MSSARAARRTTQWRSARNSSGARWVDSAASYSGRGEPRSVNRPATVIWVEKKWRARGSFLSEFFQEKRTGGGWRVPPGCVRRANGRASAEEEGYHI
jgi:hypothetical protein